MKFTDLFIKRPVLSIVVSLVIVIAGLQSIRSLSVRQYRAATSRSYRSRRFNVGAKCGPGPRIYHHAGLSASSPAPTASTTWSRRALRA